MKKVLSLLLIAVLMLGTLSFADTSKASSNTIVTWKWLNDNMKKDIIILDARTDKEYNKEHVKGALNVTWQMFTTAPTAGKKPGEQGFGIVLGNSELSKVLGSLGIDGKKTVVVYGSGAKAWGEEGRIAWTLKYAGLSNVKMLNSSYADRNVKIAVDDKAVVAKTASIQLGKYNTSLNVSTSQVKAQLNKAKIIDSRAFLEYGGATLYGEKRGGHLPGAINMPFDTFFKNGTVKTTKDVTAMMTKNGIKKTDAIIVYCTKGIRSAQVTLILKEAGYAKATNYDASFYEWAGNPDLPLK